MFCLSDNIYEIILDLKATTEEKKMYKKWPSLNIHDSIKRHDTSFSGHAHEATYT